MFSLLRVPVLLAAAVGVPYLISNGPNVDGLFDGFSSAASTAYASTKSGLLSSSPQGLSQPPSPQGPGASVYPTITPLEGMPALSLREVFDLNVTKEWVYQRWARKSTALSELGQFGIRVPIVTGTQLHDLAGSLTYFFGRDGRVERIGFHGTTGDTTQLVMLATQQFGLQQQQTPIVGEQLFQVKRKQQVLSELRTRPAPVLWDSSPHDSFAVDFQLQRSDVTTPLPSRLPPLPVVNAPPQPSPSKSIKSQGSREVEGSTGKVDVDGSKKWEFLHPRRRVPRKQVNSLDRSSQLW